MISNSNDDNLDQLLDPANLYCNEHKKLKKYYLRNEDYFLCEYDGYESAKNYCHFKDILLEYKAEVQRLKTAEVQQTNVKTTQISSKIRSSVENVFVQAENLYKFLQTFQNGYLKKLEKLTLINNELLKIKDILSHINFKDDGTVNFINIGANEIKELKILTLANILVRRKNTKNEEEFNLTSIFIEIMKEYHAILISLARYGRGWLELSINETFKELLQTEDSKYKADFSSCQFEKQIYFKEEVDEIIRNSEFQINEKNSIIENLKSEIHKLNGGINEKNTIINNLNINLNEKLTLIQEYNTIINNLKLSLEDQNAKYNSLLIEKNSLFEQYKQLSARYEELNNQFNSKTIEFNNTIRTHVLQIEEITNIKRRLEIELSEEREKNKRLSLDIERYLREIAELKNRHEDALAEASSQESEKNDLKEKYEAALDKMQEEINRLLGLRARDQELINEMRAQKIVDDSRITKLNMKIDEFNLLIQQYTLRIESLNSDINVLKMEIIELNKEKDILMESEEKLIEENNGLTDELEALKRSHSELLIDLKGQVKQSEILKTRVEELECLLKSESKSTEEITIIQSSKVTELKSQIEAIITSKEKLENEISEKKSKINHLTSEYEILKAKYESGLIEIASLKEQLKSIRILEENLLALGKKFDEVSLLNKNLEANLSHKDASILQLQQELKTSRSQNEELTIVITKHKQNISSLQNYENKINSLENTRLEIEELKRKIQTAEELNRNSARSSSKRRSRSIFNRSGVENIDKYGTVSSEQIMNNKSIALNIVSNGNSNNNIKPIDFNKTDFESIITTTTNDNRNTVVTSTNINGNVLTSQRSMTNQNVSYDINTPNVNFSKLQSYEMLLNESNAQLINDWLGETLNCRNVTTKLLYKAKVDGFSARIFKEKCYRKNNTITLVHTNYGKLIGGYTPIAWENPENCTHCYEEDASQSSFLFSVTLGEKYPIKSDMLSFAIGNTLSMGPLFGGGSDLEVVDECNMNYNSYAQTNHTYTSNRTEEEFYGDHKYLVVDYEVYEVFSG